LQVTDLPASAFQHDEDMPDARAVKSTPRDSAGGSRAAVDKLGSAKRGTLNARLLERLKPSHDTRELTIKPPRTRAAGDNPARTYEPVNAQITLSDASDCFEILWDGEPFTSVYEWADTVLRKIKHSGRENFRYAMYISLDGKPLEETRPPKDAAEERPAGISE